MSPALRHDAPFLLLSQDASSTSNSKSKPETCSCLHPCLTVVGDLLLSIREEHLYMRQISPVLPITFHTQLWYVFELKEPFSIWSEDGVEQRGLREQTASLSHTCTHTQTHTSVYIF